MLADMRHSDNCLVSSHDTILSPHSNNPTTVSLKSPQVFASELLSEQLNFKPYELHYEHELCIITFDGSLCSLHAKCCSILTDTTETWGIQNIS